MHADKPFLLVGNGSNENRGCEAINRGTLAILRAVAGENIHAFTGVLAEDSVVEWQKSQAAEGDPTPFRIAIDRPGGIAGRIKRKLLGGQQPVQVGGLADHLDNTRAVLEIGGDNYSLDYGRPEAFLEMDRQILKKGLPLAIWGASIGPFDADPLFEAEMLAHLKQLRRIFVRESVSYAYLIERGLENVTLMADPAFHLAPSAPASAEWDTHAARGAIGMNFSPFQAKLFGGERLNYWEFGPSQFNPLIELCAEIVTTVLRKHDRTVLLVPHVMTNFPWNNDWALLQRIHQSLPADVRPKVLCIPGNLRAAELKWVIGQCSIFAGSRTHATLAAFSSGVPTLTFGYSRKSVGIARDMYGHDEFCLPLKSFTLHKVSDAVNQLVATERALRVQLAATSRRAVELGLSAGNEVLELLTPSLSGTDTKKVPAAHERL